MDFFMRKEVLTHWKASDLWVIVFERVYNLSTIVEQYGPDSEAIKPLLKFAGEDVSHWFDKETEEFLNYTNVCSGKQVPFDLHGIPPHVLDTDKLNGKPVWWKNKDLQVGVITKKQRTVRIINTLTDTMTTLECCTEDSLQKIKDRYSALGFDVSHSAFTWMSFLTGKELDLEKTLDENNIPDESAHFEELCLPDDLHIPSILLFYNNVITPPLPLRLDPNLDLTFDIQ
ncbi:Hypothetical predicted protein [Cloeon dipterum]|uniref:Cytochrome b5 domain-containing protein 1 n=1 Tax=Cloeon dipterum TaxID=197152 RepID=A0A8S1CRT0_9INSE|nr:Hypothetical predicted protein [Cloeon dipterum]